MNNINPCKVCGHIINGINRSSTGSINSGGSVEMYIDHEIYCFNTEECQDTTVAVQIKGEGVLLTEEAEQCLINLWNAINPIK